MKKLLIVYYSWSNGNTERIAKTLQSAAGGTRYIEVLFFSKPLELLQRSPEEIDHCIFSRSENEPHIHDVESF